MKEEKEAKARKERKAHSEEWLMRTDTLEWPEQKEKDREAEKEEVS